MPGDVRAAVIAELAERGPLPPDADLDRFDFLDSGHVNSLGVLTFVTALERAFDVELEDDDIAGEGFRTVGGLTALIEGKLAARSGA